MIGTLVAIWWAIDGLVLFTVIVLAAWLSPPLVFAVALVICFAINLAACNWVDRHWDRWMAKGGGKLERKLEKMRTSSLMKHPVAWLQRGSDFWFGLGTRGRRVRRSLVHERSCDCRGHPSRTAVHRDQLHGEPSSAWRGLKTPIRKNRSAL
jgi:hypothetical protein